MQNANLPSPVINRAEINGSTFLEKKESEKKNSKFKVEHQIYRDSDLAKFMSINYMLECWCIKGNIVKLQPPHVRKQNVDEQF